MEIIADKRPLGHLCLVLHAHLPFVRDPDQEHHLEESWLYEAMTESYMPLLHTFEDLLNDGVDFRITVSLSPPLLSMFRDDLLQRRYSDYLVRLENLADREITRNRNDSHSEALARMYKEKIRLTSDRYNNLYRRDLVSAFRSLADSGHVELITSSATHAYLPSLLSEPASLRAQLTIGRDYFKEATGLAAGGMWLPECGFSPEMDPLIRDAGVKFFFVESHGLVAGAPKPRFSIYAPAKTPSGAMVFARDVDSSSQVWSSVKGYPGDPDYRDFYRDAGFDIGFEGLREFLPHGIRTFTGLKYYRITGMSGEKLPYIPEAAIKKAEEHAGDFLRKKEAQVAALGGRLGIRPLITAAYDAELFGHWWFEGPHWLRTFLINLSGPSGRSIRPVTPSEYMSEHTAMETVMPSMSSWGKKGYGATWIDESNDWMYRRLISASGLMSGASADNMSASGLKRRALNQAARELLLAQSSDWAFMINSGSAAEFAKNRFIEHTGNFFYLQSAIKNDAIDAAKVGRLEDKDNIFQTLDFRTFCGRS